MNRCPIMGHTGAADLHVLTRGKRRILRLTSSWYLAWPRIAWLLALCVLEGIRGQKRPFAKRCRSCGSAVAGGGRRVPIAHELEAGVPSCGHGRHRLGSRKFGKAAYSWKAIGGFCRCLRKGDVPYGWARTLRGCCLVGWGSRKDVSLFLTLFPCEFGAR